MDAQADTEQTDTDPHKSLRSDIKSGSDNRV